MVGEIIRIAKAAGEIALGADADRHVTAKEGRANFVTEYDKRVQSFIIGELSKLLPEARFVGEESDEFDAVGYDGYKFIIDPIDGTTNFIRGSAFYSVCIGLFYGDSQVCGVVHVPALDTTYFAEAGKGAFVTRGGVTKAIHVSGLGLDGAVIALGTSPYNAELVTKSFEYSKKLLLRAADIRRAGSAALDICYVAEGIYDIMFELKLSIWDHAAADIILTEAGGRSSDMNGGSACGSVSTSYVAGTPLAQSEFIDYIKTFEC